MLEFLPGPVRQLARGMIKIIFLGVVILLVMLGPVGIIGDIILLLSVGSYLGIDLLRKKDLAHEGKNE